MVFRRHGHLLRLASVLALVVAAAAAAVAAVAAAVAAASISAAVAAVCAGGLLCHRLRPLHRRSERPELHSLAQLSVELQQQSGVLHHAVAARHWKAPDSDLIQDAAMVRHSPRTYTVWIQRLVLRSRRPFQFCVGPGTDRMDHLHRVVFTRH